MASWQNVTLTKCQADEMASRKNDELSKCQAEETAKHQMFHDFYRGQSDPLYSESLRLKLESVQLRLNFCYSNDDHIRRECTGAKIDTLAPFLKLLSICRVVPPIRDK